MTDPPEPAPDFQPWELRLLAHMGLPPAASGILIVAVLVAAHFAIYALLGLPLAEREAVFGLREPPRNYVLAVFLLGYAIGAFGYAAAGQQRDLESLGLSLDRFRSKQFAWRSRRAGLVGVVLGYGVVEIVQRAFRPDGSAIDLIIHPEYAVAFVVTIVATGVIGRFFHYIIQRSPLDERVEGPVDLLDLRPFQVLGRLSLRRSILLLVLISTQTPWIFIPGFGRIFILLMTAGLVVPTALLLVPLRGARGRIRDAEQAELAKVDGELRALRSQALGGQPTAQERMTFLLGYRSLIQEIPEWPFEASALRRFGLYLLLPFGSWLASAFVERSVDALLD